MKNSMRPKPAQLSVIAVAALAIVAVTAAILLSGGNPAQADTSTLDGVSGGHLAQDRPSGQSPPPPPDPTPEPTPEPTATPTPRTHATPEPCPGETGNPNTAAAPAVDSGHIALFDVWWNTEELELTNSSCPPTVRHVPAQGSAAASDVRTESSINIEETVIHIPSTAKVALTEAKYPKAKFKKLWDADDAENPNGSGDGYVWALPACPPDGNPATNGLCLSFSAALLNDADWTGNIVYHVDHVHQTDIDKQDPRYVLAFEVPDDETATPYVPLWNSQDARRSEMGVAPGGYHRPMWFFTSRGAYQFQVHITGEPDQTHADPVSKDPSVNSDVREYTIHVGAEADLGVTATMTPANPSPGNEVTITLTASNAGPDTAPGTKVEVNLPEGLTYSSHVPADDDFTESEGIRTWDAGSLAQDASKTLTITARVDEGTRGETLEVEATISATETLHIKEIVRDENGEPQRDPKTGGYQLVDQAYPVAVPDPVSGNNTLDPAVTVTVPSIPNVDPMFKVTRSVPENSAAGTNVGDPIKVKEPNAGDTLTYTLTGNGAGKFTASSVEGGTQIAVAQGATINYEDAASYELVLCVSDGEDERGNNDASVDQCNALSINIEDDSSEVLAITLTADRTSQVVNAHVNFTWRVTSSPVASDRLSYLWKEKNYYPADPEDRVLDHSPTSPKRVTYGRAAQRDYFIDVWDRDGGDEGPSASQYVRITWTN